MENLLSKKKKEYRNAAIFITILFVSVSFIAINNKKLETKTLVLAKKPTFEESKTVKNSSYWIELNFKDSKKTYRISDIDYKYIDLEKFSSEVNKNDTVKISYQNEQVCKISKSGYEYLKFDKAKSHQFKRRLIICILYLFTISFCIWVNFLKQIPILKLQQKKIEINIDYLFLGLLATLFLILNLTIGLDYFFSKQFMQ